MYLKNTLIVESLIMQIYNFMFSLLNIIYINILLCFQSTQILLSMYQLKKAWSTSGLYKTGF